MVDGRNRERTTAALRSPMITGDRRRAGVRRAIVASSALLLGTAVFAPFHGVAKSTHALPPAPQLASFAFQGRPRLVAIDASAGRGYVLSWDDPASVQVQGEGLGLGTHVVSIDLRSARLQHSVLVPRSQVGDSGVALGVDARSGRVYTIVDAPQQSVVTHTKDGGKRFSYTNDVLATSFDGPTLRSLHAALTPGLLPQDVVAVGNHIFMGIGGGAIGGARGAEGSAVLMLSGTTGAVLRNAPQHAMVWQLGVDATFGHGQVLVYTAQVQPRGGWWTRSAILFLDAKTGRSLRTVDLGAFPAQVPNDWITVDAVHHRAFAVGRHLLLALDTRTGRVLSRTPLVGNVETLTSDSRNGRVVVASTMSPQSTRAFLTVVDGATGRRIAPVQMVDGPQIALGVDDRRHRVLVFSSALAHNGDVSGRVPRGRLLLLDDRTGRTTTTYAWYGAALNVAVDAQDDRALVLSDVRVRVSTTLNYLSPRDSGATILDLARL